MAYTFRPPHVIEAGSGGHRLFQFSGLNKGVTVVQSGSKFYETQFPSQDLLDIADKYWLGGHIYTVDNATAADLTAAGYGSNLTEIV